MEKNRDILNELQNISPLLAGMEKVNVFTVPDGYFDSISNTVMLGISEDFSIDTSFIESQDVPKGYFDNLPGNILNKIKNHVGTTVQSNETNELPEILSTLQRNHPFSVPGNYFETLADSIMNRIKMKGEEESLPTVLQDLKSIPSFVTPAHYFEDLPAQILEKVKQDTGAKVVFITRRFPVFKYAAAAMITGALALGIYKYSNKSFPVTIDPSSTVQLDPSIEKGKAMDEQKFNETLNSLSEEEIVNYLQKNNSETDIAILSSDLEEKNLPSQEDYLLDNQTLDNFLKEIDTKAN